MGRRGAIEILLLVGAVVAVAALWNRREDREPVTERTEEQTVPEDAVTNGILGGVVRRADGGAATGASVFLDAWFQNLGEPDYKMAIASRSAVQNADGEWEWVELPDELLKHEPFKTAADAQGRYFFEETPELRELLGEGRVKIWAELDDQVARKVLVRAESKHVRVPPLTLGPALRPRVQVETRSGTPVADGDKAI